MHETEHRSFSTPDETREFASGRAEILHVGGGEVGRLVFQPGCDGRLTSSRPPRPRAARHLIFSTT